jgi:DNA polymerase-3 subunit alpha
MKNFFNNFTEYKNCVPPGVRLPQIEIDKKYYERLNLKDDVDNFTFLKNLCDKKLKENSLGKNYSARLSSELEILNKLGFTDYILLNWDIINFCHENNIPVGPGRGSAAGSLVLFLIGVTSIDPVKYELFFERFVSESRAKKIEVDGITYLDGSLLADVDNDIAYEHRQKVIDYIEAKNPSRTSKILTLNSLSSKLCIKECGKIVSEFSEKDVNAVSDLIPKKFGKVFSLEKATEESERFLSWSKENPECFKIARKLEGLYKNTGVHPSGIAISFFKISEICPLQSTNDGSIITGYDMNWVSELMVKFDILGLRTLSVIYDVCNNINVDIKKVNLDDPSIYLPLQESLRSPHGLFQIEADTNFRVCKTVKPKSLEQLSAVIAIARPGALEFTELYAEYVKTNDSNVIHDFFAEELSYTGGIPLYQEQLMKMAVRIGFSLDESEQLRRIVGKKKVDQMSLWQDKIKEKVSLNNLPPEVGEILWKVAEDSANYSFNKSHSIAYSTLAAWTTFLKFNYTQEFFLSLLKMTKFEPAPQEEISQISKELSFFNIKLLPPDLERSEMDFSKENSDIRFGLNSIKGVSEKSLQSLSKFRSKKQPNKFKTFVQAKESGLNIGILSSLIQAGCLPSYSCSRSLLALEAQSFNLLTDREKKLTIDLAPKYNYMLLDIIAAAKEGLIAKDGKPLMKESRFNTFKSKYEKYKSIYLQNKQYEKFANWYFESKLLGYSYSSDLKSVFNDSEIIYNSNDFYNNDSCRGKFIGIVFDYYKGTSRNGNKYVKLILHDEYGKYPVMFMDNSRGAKYSEYLDSGKKLPEKDDIIGVIGSKFSDIIFADNILPLQEKIYMKLGDIR